MKGGKILTNFFQGVVVLKTFYLVVSHKHFNLAYFRSHLLRALRILFFLVRIVLLQMGSEAGGFGVNFDLRDLDRFIIWRLLNWGINFLYWGMNFYNCRFCDIFELNIIFSYTWRPLLRVIEVIVDALISILTLLWD